MQELEILEEAFLAVENGKIAGFGPMRDWEGISDWNGLEIIDAEGQFVLPAFCDSHTHLVFAKTREAEFVDRIKGLSYEDIAKRGGGILNSAKATQNASEDELFESAMHRLHQVILMGTGAIEIKSGYGLSLEAELKMLRVIERIKKTSPIPVKATFLGAHAYPKEYKENKEAYLKLIIDEMLPAVASEKLADYVDVFCEKNYFGLEETQRILEAAAKYDLRPKVHVNQFNAMGGIKLCVEQNAVSVDHLEVLNSEDLTALQNSNCIPVALPSCSFFLGLPYTPAREIIGSNLGLALASDYNPGSTPSGNLQFVFSLACIKMGLLPAEALNALTINAAHAMELQDQLGSISIGMDANLILTKKIPSINYIPYSFGENLVEQRIINGKIYQ